MFNREDLECLDPEYFEIIYMDDRDVIIMSRNTGHVWYIHDPEYPLMDSVSYFINIRCPIPVPSAWPQ